MSKEEYKIWLSGLSNNMFFDECYRQVKRLYMGFDNWKLELCEVESDNRSGDIMDLATAKVIQEYR